MSIDYQFAPVPVNYIENIQCELNRSSLLVMNTILKLTTGARRGGRTMTSSYLRLFCKISERAIRSAIQGLKEKGLILVEYKPFRGRLSKFITVCENVFATVVRPTEKPKPEVKQAKIIIEPVVAEVAQVVLKEVVDSVAAVPAVIQVLEPAPVSVATVLPSETKPVNATLLSRLLKQGMEAGVAHRILGEHEESVVDNALKHLHSRKNVTNRAGFLYAEIKRGGYSEPKVISPEQKIRDKYEQIAKLRQAESEATERARDSEGQMYERALEVYRGLSGGEQEQLQAQARKDAGRVPVGPTMDCPILRGFVLEQLVHKLKTAVKAQLSKCPYAHRDLRNKSS